MTDKKPEILIMDIDPAHLSTRELALRAIYGHVNIPSPVIVIEPPPRLPDLEMPVKVRAPKAALQRVQRPKPFKKEKSESLKRLLRK